MVLRGSPGTMSSQTFRKLACFQRSVSKASACPIVLAPVVSPSEHYFWIANNDIEAIKAAAAEAFNAAPFLLIRLRRTEAEATAIVLPLIRPRGCRNCRAGAETARPGPRMEDGCQRRLCRVPARAARSARPRHHAAYVRQDRRVLRRTDVRDGDGRYAVLPG